MEGDRRWADRIRLRWSDLELFGCHPNRKAARNRFDYAGAVTLAAMSGHSIERITEHAAHYENGLVYYRKRHIPADAVPVWELKVDIDKPRKETS